MERRFLVSIAQMYYEKNMSQQEIANQMNVSRVKISRSLKKAKEQGIIKFIIDYRGTFIELEEEIQNKYNLQDVVIVENALGENSIKQVQQAAAQYLQTNIQNNDTIAVGWGNTLKGVADYMYPLESKNLVFTPIIGGHSVDHSQLHSSTIASEMAAAVGGESLSINAPALVPSIKEKQAIIENQSIASVIEKTTNSNIAIFSLGNPLFSQSSIHKVNYFSQQELLELKKNNVVCDFVSIDFLNKGGKQKCTEISNRTIGIQIDNLLNIPTKICLISNEEKHESVLAALKAKYIDVLIIDKATADFLINP